MLSIMRAVETSPESSTWLSFRICLSWAGSGLKTSTSYFSLRRSAYLMRGHFWSRSMSKPPTLNCKVPHVSLATYLSISS